MFQDSFMREKKAVLPGHVKDGDTIVRADLMKDSALTVGFPILWPGLECQGFSALLHYIWLELELRPEG